MCMCAPQCCDNLILREEARVVPILMSRPSRVCLAAIMRLRFVIIPVCCNEGLISALTVLYSPS